MQKDKVGLNIYTIQYTFKVSLLPETALIDIKWYLTGRVGYKRITNYVCWANSYYLDVFN